MDNDLKRSVSTAEKEAQYDEKAKKLLSHKIILAHILVNTIDEFKGMEPKNVVSYIEGETYISKVPVDAGSTNAKKKEAEQIVGLNTENSEPNEGTVRFDIIFYVRLKDGISQIILNVELQKSKPSGYHLLNRGAYYGCRMISSQKGREFVKMNYNDIKQIYSIWICLNISENCMNFVHLTQENVLGTYDWDGNIDLLNIILIGLADTLPEKEKQYGLHRLLGALFSTRLEVSEKFYILEHEFGVELEDGIGKDVNDMCNLGEGIREEALAEGLSEGVVKGRAESIIELLELFNEKIPKTVIEIIQKEKDRSLLTKWNKNAARSNSLEEFIQMM